jgi:hypothetical protein
MSAPHRALLGPGLSFFLLRKCMMKTVLLCVLSLSVAVGCARHKATMVVYKSPNANPYSAPLISPGTKFASLPPAVQHTIRAETGGSQIDDIVKDTRSGSVVYRIYFIDNESLPPLYVAPDGSVLYRDLTVAVGAATDSVGVLTGGPNSSVTLGDLPPRVVKVIQQRAPDAEIGAISKETRGDQIVYVVQFKDKRHPPISVSADGTFLGAKPPP